MDNKIMIIRNPEWMNGKTSEYPFALMMIFGEYKRTFPYKSWDEIVKIANELSNETRTNYYIEEGL